MPKLSPDGPYLHDGVQISGSTFGGYTEVGQGSRINQCSFGDYAYCDRFSDIANTTVGPFANIAAFTRIGPTDHPMGNASLHHFLYRSSYYWEDAEDDLAFFARRTARRTVLGADCWIGHAAIIRPDVTIGIGSVVGAGAVVTKDVADYTIVAGVPAVTVRPRFAPEIAARMTALAWWTWPHDQLRASLPDFRALSAEDFLTAYGG